MNEKISIDEIHEELNRIIEAPTDRQMLNGIWWLRNKIAGHCNADKLNECIVANKRLAADVRRHENRRRELENEIKNIKTKED